MKYVYGVIFIIIAIVIVVLLKKLPIEEQTIVNYVSIFGTYLTLCGLIVTFVQIWHTKRVSKETQELVNAAQEKIKYILSVADFSKAIKTVQEIQGYISEDKIESAVLRLSEIKEILIYVKQSPEFNVFADVNKCQELISQTGINLQKLRDYMQMKKTFNKSYFGEELEQLSTLFISIETSLKKKAYDTK